MKENGSKKAGEAVKANRAEVRTARWGPRSSDDTTVAVARMLSAFFITKKEKNKLFSYAEYFTIY